MNKKKHILANISNTSAIKSRCKLCGHFYEWFIIHPGHYAAKHPTKPVQTALYNSKMLFPDTKVVPFDCTIKIDGLEYNPAYHKYHKKQDTYWEQEFLYCENCLLSKVTIQVKVRKNKPSNINRCGKYSYPRKYLA